MCSLRRNQKLFQFRQIREFYNFSDFLLFLFLGASKLTTGETKSLFSLAKFVSEDMFQCLGLVYSLSVPPIDYLLTNTNPNQ